MNVRDEQSAAAEWIISISLKNLLLSRRGDFFYKMLVFDERDGSLTWRLGLTSFMKIKLSLKAH